MIAKTIYKQWICQYGTQLEVTIYGGSGNCNQSATWIYHKMGIDQSHYLQKPPKFSVQTNIMNQTIEICDQLPGQEQCGMGLLLPCSLTTWPTTRRLQLRRIT